MELFQKIRTSIDALEKEEDDFDSVAYSLSIIQHAVMLVRTLYQNDRIREWKDKEDPTFDRFASKLKSVLESQRDYLYSVSDLLIVDNDLISKKIASCQKEIESVLEKEDSILKQSAELFEKENKLQEDKKRLEFLLQRKEELEKIAQDLAKNDPEALSAEIKAKEESNRKLENEYKPLLNKKESLEQEYKELHESVQSLSDEIARIENSYGEEAMRLSESIPQWIQKIKARKIQRDEKIQKYLFELEHESEELKRTENQVQEHLKKIEKLSNDVMTCQEILRKHFQANKTLGDRFSKSLPELQNEIMQINSKIESELSKSDNMLKQMHRRIEEIALEVNQIHI